MRPILVHSCQKALCLCLTHAVATPRLAHVELHLPPDKETRLLQFARRIGKDAEQVVEEAVDSTLNYEEPFLAAVEDGRASSRHGDLLEHDDVVGRIKKMLRS